MRIYTAKEYSIIMITMQNLIKDGWEFTVKDGKDYFEKGGNPITGEWMDFETEKDVKDWILEKALDY